MSSYRGITYPGLLGYVLPMWRRMCCPREWHLFDELWTGTGHALVCDACGLIVHIESIEQEDAGS